jgi:hypothetical protein
MIGKTLGRHQITEKLAESGMGEAFPLKNRHTFYQNAFEVLTYQYGQDVEGLDCIKREVMLLLREELRRM